MTGESRGKKLQNKEATMQVITFSSIKGGVGKTSLGILVANALSTKKRKILFVDSDPQNSSSFFYDPEGRAASVNASLANVLKGGNIKDNITPTLQPGVDIVSSAFELLNSECQNCDHDILQTELSTLKGYDYCIIDTSPTVNDIVVNAIKVSNIVVMPVTLTLFDYRGALFYLHDWMPARNIQQYADKIHLLFNHFKPFTRGGTAEAVLYGRFATDFPHILKTRVPTSAQLKKYFNVNTTISRAKTKEAVYGSICDLVKELTGEKITSERF